MAPLAGRGVSSGCGSVVRHFGKVPRNMAWALEELVLHSDQLAQVADLDTPDARGRLRDP